jgi:hypothetical protein
MLVHVVDEQRCHTRAKVGAGDPLHEPSVAVNVDPTAAEPLIAGSAVFTGPVPATVAVCADVAVPVPDALVAVTTTCSCDPASADATT